MSGPQGPRPGAGLAGTQAYAVPRAPTPIDLHLDGNEGLTPDATLWQAVVAQGPDLIRRYPDKRPLERLLARRLGVAEDQVLVTSGADDALDRICRAFLDRERHLILPEPTFEMLNRYPTVLGAEIVSVPWPEGPYPLDEVLARVNERTGVIAVVTPNNPTGAIATAEDVRRLSAEAPHAVVILDHAYVEYGDEDLSFLAGECPNVIVTRSLSKACGLAGLRLGYALGPAKLLQWLDAAGSPYPVTGPSVALAVQHLQGADASIQDHVARVREERGRLFELLAGLGTEPLPSQANFVTTRCRDSRWLRDGMAGLGIGVRYFADRPGLETSVRVTCPGNPQDFERLETALRAVLQPEAILLDMDGVLADVSGSYRQCVLRTAAHFGVEVTQEQVLAAKVAGDANNDWIVTQRLLAAVGVDVSLDQVTEVFQDLYQGTATITGLRDTERLLMSRETLERLARVGPLAVVTGRPRDDMEYFLELHGLTDLIPVSVCMGDAASKPDPAGVRLALERLGVRHAWMLGDTPDDIRAARGAGVVALGVVAPGDDFDTLAEALYAAGAGRVWTKPDQILEILP